MANNKYKVSGNSSEKVGDYSVWKIVDEEGQTIANIYGPMSAIVVATAVRELNTSSACRVADILKYEK